MRAASARSPGRDGEEALGVRGLRGRPRAHLGALAVLEPAVRIGDGARRAAPRPRLRVARRGAAGNGRPGGGDVGIGRAEGTGDNGLTVKTGLAVRPTVRQCTARRARRSLRRALRKPECRYGSAGASVAAACPDAGITGCLQGGFDGDPATPQNADPNGPRQSGSSSSPARIRKASRRRAVRRPQGQYGGPNQHGQPG